MPRYRYVPSTYDPSLDMAALFPAVDVTTGVDLLARPGSRTLVPDFLNQTWVNLMNQVRAWTSAAYAGQKWTTLCFSQQGTTSLWMFDLAFNGLSNPLQLQPGMVLRFPLVSEVRRVFSNSQAATGVGQSVSIGPPNIVDKLF